MNSPAPTAPPMAIIAMWRRRSECASPEVPDEVVEEVRSQITAPDTIGRDTAARPPRPQPRDSLRRGKHHPACACNDRCVLLIRGLTIPLLTTATYARWVHLILGGVVFMPYLMATAVLSSLVATGDTATGGPSATAPGSALAVGLLPALVLVAATAWLPGARTMETHLVRT